MFSQEAFSTPARPVFPLARRMRGLRGSRIREILKATDAARRPDMISFGGGLPDPRYLPVEDLARAAERVLARAGRRLLQYAPSEGMPELRAWIAERYRRRFGLAIDPETILITGGSQQALDLIGKLAIDPGATVYIERPSYLGAIQAFAAYEPNFRGLPLGADGVDHEALADAARRHGPGLFYCVPNFQNPAGVRYTRETRTAVAELAGRGLIYPVEDDPYGELRFEGEDLPPLRALHADTILLGSFSKIVAPGLRLGWVCAPRELFPRLVAAKQAADLHTNMLAQGVLLEYLQECDLDAQIERIRAAYRRNRDAMATALRRHLPAVRFHPPAGGMFLWCRLPPGVSADEVFTRALAAGVAVVPGTTFFAGANDVEGDRYLRLNYSNSTPEAIETGIARLAGVCAEVAAPARPFSQGVDSQ